MAELTGDVAKARDVIGELVADRVVGIALGHEAEDLAFPLGERVERVALLVREIAAGMPVPVQIDVDGPVEDLSPGLRALIYFFCSECLANKAKHAEARAATGRMNVNILFCPR